MAGVPESLASLKDSSWQEKGSYEEKDSLKETQCTLDKLEWNAHAVTCNKSQ
jgi:hypothetical protein